jgi:hypothetical protein
MEHQVPVPISGSELRWRLRPLAIILPVTFHILALSPKGVVRLGFGEASLPHLPKPYSLDLEGAGSMLDT